MLLETKPPQVVIGTPGRLLDLIERKKMKLDNISFFVVDECDQCFKNLDMR